jgi:methylthioribose-1-phosphate isomerase
MQNVRLIPAGSDTANPAFDVTPARLVTGIITERGVFSPADLVGMRLSKACD